eukprot:scaffold6.g2845.t1
MKRGMIQSSQVVTTLITSVRSFRGKWMLDGCSTLAEVRQRLREQIECFKQLEEEGWQLRDEVQDDYVSPCAAAADMEAIVLQRLASLPAPRRARPCALQAPPLSKHARLARWLASATADRPAQAQGSAQRRGRQQQQRTAHPPRQRPRPQHAQQKKAAPETTPAVAGALCDAGVQDLAAMLGRLSAAKREELAELSNIHAVLSYLRKELGLERPAVAALIEAAPNLVALPLGEQARPLFEALASQGGLSAPEAAALVAREPGLAFKARGGPGALRSHGGCRAARPAENRAGHCAVCCRPFLLGTRARPAEIADTLAFLQQALAWHVQPAHSSDAAAAVADGAGPPAPTLARLLTERRGGAALATCSRAHVERVAVCLAALGMTRAAIAEALWGGPAVFRCDPAALRRNAAVLSSALGLDIAPAAALLTREPALTGLAAKVLRQRAAALATLFGGAEAGARAAVEAVSRCPGLLAAEPSRWHASMAVMQLLGLAPADAQQAANASPQLLLEDMAAPTFAAKLLVFQELRSLYPEQRFLPHQLLLEHATAAGQPARTAACRLAFLRASGALPAEGPASAAVPVEAVLQACWLSGTADYCALFSLDREAFARFSAAYKGSSEWRQMLQRAEAAATELQQRLMASAGGRRPGGSASEGCTQLPAAMEAPPPQAALGAAPAPRGRLAPFSTHARGVPLFDWGRILDVPRHLARILLDLRDLSSSLFWFLSCQTWLTMWGSIVTIVSVSFFTYYRGGEVATSNNQLALDLDWTLISFTVVLPLVGLIWFGFARRERCLDELAKARILMTSIYAAHRDWVPEDRRPPGQLEAVRDALLALVAAMRAYFPHARFYAKFYPYMGRAMVQIALDQSRYNRRIADAFDVLAHATAALGGAPGGAGAVSSVLVGRLHDQIYRLQLALGRMANVKEFRTPQARGRAAAGRAGGAGGVRSMARFYVCLFIPLFFGPYWSWVALNIDFGFAFFFSVVLEITLVGLLNVSLALEDPFDNNGLDGVFIDEALYEMESYIAGSAPPPPGVEDAEAEERQQLGGGGAAAAPTVGDGKAGLPSSSASPANIAATTPFTARVVGGRKSLRSKAAPAGEQLGSNVTVATDAV